MPPLRYNTKDDLQASYLRRHGITGAPPDRQVPSSHGFLEGVLAGVGWGLLPQAQLAPHVAAGRLVVLADDHVDVPLFWQRWRIPSPRLDRLTEAVLSAAAQGLGL